MEMRLGPLLRPSSDLGDGSGFNQARSIPTGPLWGPQLTHSQLAPHVLCGSCTSLLFPGPVAACPPHRQPAGSPIFASKGETSLKEHALAPHGIPKEALSPPTSLLPSNSILQLTTSPKSRNARPREQERGFSKEEEKKGALVSREALHTAQRSPFLLNFHLVAPGNQAIIFF